MRKKQPTSNFCFVCGRENPFGLHLEFYDEAPGVVGAGITVPDQFQGYPGIVHGGVVAAMLDEVTGRVFMGDGANPRFMVTAKLDIRYRRPVPIGQPLRLVGRAGKDNGRVASATGEILDGDGKTLAEVEAVYVNIPEQALANVDHVALGWRVVPDEEVMP